MIGMVLAAAIGAVGTTYDDVRIEGDPAHLSCRVESPSALICTKKVSGKDRAARGVKVGHIYTAHITSDAPLAYVESAQALCPAGHICQISPVSSLSKRPALGAAPCFYNMPGPFWHVDGRPFTGEETGVSFQRQAVCKAHAERDMKIAAKH